jgi:hypothetical protein
MMFTTMRGGDMSGAFAEGDIFLQEKATLAKAREQVDAHPGEWVVVIGERVLGFYRTYQLATQAGDAALAGERFFVRFLGHDPVPQQVGINAGRHVGDVPAERYIAETTESFQEIMDRHLSSAR